MSGGGIALFVLLLIDKSGSQNCVLGGLKTFSLAVTKCLVIEH